MSGAAAIDPESIDLVIAATHHRRLRDATVRDEWVFGPGDSWRGVAAWGVQQVGGFGSVNDRAAVLPGRMVHARDGLRQQGVRVGEVGGDLGADGLDGDDGADGDDADQEAVLNQVLPLLVTNEPRNEVAHVSRILEICERVELVRSLVAPRSPGRPALLMCHAVRQRAMSIC